MDETGTTTGTTGHEALMWDEVDDIGLLLADLDEDEFDAPSLCDGWMVRDVIGHMSYGHTTPLRRVVADALRLRVGVERASFLASKAFAAQRTPAELRATWRRELVEGRARRGIARFIAWDVGFLDHLIHHQDMRRPLGRHRDIPEDRLRAALDLLPVVKTPMFATRPVVEGLRLEATDLDWSWGEGPRVAGPGESLVMACGGRRHALAELSGAGVDVVSGRLGG